MNIMENKTATTENKTATTENKTATMEDKRRRRNIPFYCIDCKASLSADNFYIHRNEKPYSRCKMHQSKYSYMTQGYVKKGSRTITEPYKKRQARNYFKPLLKLDMKTRESLLSDLKYHNEDEKALTLRDISRRYELKYKTLIYWYKMIKKMNFQITTNPEIKT